MSRINDAVIVFDGHTIISSEPYGDVARRLANALRGTRGSFEVDVQGVECTVNINRVSYVTSVAAQNLNSPDGSQKLSDWLEVDDGEPIHDAGY